MSFHLRDWSPAASAIAPDMTRKPNEILVIGKNAIPMRRSAGYKK